MKNKFLAILMSVAMTFSFAACGGGDAPAEETSAPAAEEVVEEAAPAEEAAAEEEVDLTGWSCYQGVMPDGETTIFFAVDETATRGAMFMLSADCTQSISVIGNYVYDEAAGIESLTDDETGLQINFTTTDNGDGTLTVDMGDGDVATIAAAEAQTVIDAMDVIAAETTDVTAEYIAGLQ